MLHSARRLKVIKPRVVYIIEPTGGSDSSDALVSSDEEHDVRFSYAKAGPDSPAEYWHIQKLIKYIKVADQTATNAALCVLRDHDLKAVISQNAIRNVGGLEILVNLLETNDHRSKSGSMEIMLRISANPLMRRDLTNLGVIPILVNLVGGMARDLQILAADCIAVICKVRKARRFLRKYKGIPLMVELLDVTDNALYSEMSSLNEEEVEEVDVVRAAASALWTLSLSGKNRTHMMRCGCVPLLAKVARSVHVEVTLPLVGTLQECADETKYQVAILSEEIVLEFVRYLANSNEDLVKQTAKAICKTAAVYEPIRHQIRIDGGLEALVNVLKTTHMRENKPLMAAVTGAIWKCALGIENVHHFTEIRTVEVLVIMLHLDDDEVLGNTAGALAELCQIDENRASLRVAGGLPPLVNMLNLDEEQMLVNVARVLGECACNAECMLAIEELDGVRLVWSQLKHSSSRVQAAAAATLVPCVKNAFDSGELVRTFVGGLELIVNRLRSNDEDVIANVCAAIAQITEDQENLAVVTEHNVVSLLSRHVHSTDDNVREYLSNAVSRCCRWGNNAFEFGRLGATQGLCTYMEGGNPQVNRATMIALYHLSADPYNCIEMQASGVIKYLLDAVGSLDLELQNASMGALRNMRQLALRAEDFKIKHGHTLH